MVELRIERENRIARLYFIQGICVEKRDRIWIADVLLKEVRLRDNTKPWSGWKKLGYEVIHGSRALFGCSLIWGSKGDGVVYNARFFGKSQVQAIV